LTGLPGSEFASEVPDQRRLHRGRDQPRPAPQARTGQSPPRGGRGVPARHRFGATCGPGEETL